MSKLGKRPIIIPEKVSLEIEERKIKIKGPLGENVLILPEEFEILINNNMVNIKPKIINKKTKIMWGTLRSLLANKILGVSQGFNRTLILEGLGYSAELISERELSFKVGFSHPIKISIPEEIKVEIKPLKGQFHLIVSGKDKEKVGQFTAQIKKIKPRDSYKLKGFRYLEEKVKTKQVKKAVGK
ncbi:MAG: 50S ribosomal protein L6 [Patescibacteria group bacterium]|nr:50S ribosomal protein L6 [Patescibacteria group bacterium]